MKRQQHSIAALVLLLAIWGAPAASADPTAPTCTPGHGAGLQGGGNSAIPAGGAGLVGNSAEPPAAAEVAGVPDHANAAGLTGGGNSANPAGAGLVGNGGEPPAGVPAGAGHC